MKQVEKQGRTKQTGKSPFCPGDENTGRESEYLQVDLFKQKQNYRIGSPAPLWVDRATTVILRLSHYLELN